MTVIVWSVIFISVCVWLRHTPKKPVGYYDKNKKQALLLFGPSTSVSKLFSRAEQKWLKTCFFFFFLGLKGANPSLRKCPHSDAAPLVLLSVQVVVQYGEKLPPYPPLRFCGCVSASTLVSCETATRLRGEMRETRSSAAARLLPLLCCAYATAGYIFTPQELDVTPRVTVTSSGELKRP